jgi:cysteinyl-tRNA synthetase
MGKSANNFITISTLKEKNIIPLAYRYFVLGTHYRQKLNFSWEALLQAQQSLFNLYEQLENLPAPTKPLLEYEENFQKALADDLNTPQALAVVWNLIKSKADPAAIASTIFKFDEVLGLKLQETILHLQQKNKHLPAEVERLVTQRATSRENKDWQLSDTLRTKIETYEYRVIDNSEGQKLIKIPTYSDFA